MEVNNNESVQIGGSLPGKSTSGSIAESNSSEVSDATKTILEDVCMDFESMDVVCPKASTKVDVAKNIRHSSSSGNKNSKTTAAKSVTPVKNVTPVKATKVKELAKTVLPADELQLGAVNPSEVNLPADQIHPIVSGNPLYTSVASADDYSQQVLAISDLQDPGNVTILPESALKNLPSLAQLADAEIVQSGDSVSIIVTNTRLINVLTTDPNNALDMVETADVIDPTSADILETDVRTVQPMSIIDPTLFDDSVYQGVSVEDDSNVVQETVITERESGSATVESKTKPRVGCGRGRPPKKAFETVYSSPA